MGNDAVAGTGDARATDWRRGSPRWRLLAYTILILCIGASLAGAALWRSGARSAEKSEFNSTAQDVTANLQTLLQRDVDLITTLRAVLMLEPQMSTRDFQTWFRDLGGAGREAGTLGTVVVSAVPESRMIAFQTARNRDPAYRALMGGVTRTIQPNTHQQSYCLLTAAASLVPIGSLATTLQADWCDSTSPVIGGSAPEFDLAARSGQILAAPVSFQGFEVGFFDTAFYRAGAPLDNVAQRGSALRGWIASSFNLFSLLSAATGTHQGLSVTLYHTNPGERWEQVGHTGTRSGPFSRLAHMNVDGKWLVAVKGQVRGTGISTELQGLLVLIGGLVVSFLLFLLIASLARSREQALGMVQETTGQLHHQSLHDLLTGLPNRVLVLERAGQMLERARAAQLPVVALYVDVDNLGQINDLYGHGVGDLCVQVVADRLHSVLRDGDMLARVDGDEFAILLEGPVLGSEAETIAERVLETVRVPIDLNGKVGRQLPMTVSIGISQSVNDTAETLLANAKMAQTVAKSSGKNLRVRFQSEMDTAAKDRLSLALDLADALDEGQFFLVYQPIVDLHDQRVTGLEALLRWRHPERGIVSPAAFIPLAEESDAIVDIGRWVLCEACQQAAEWRAGGDALRISVNVSARQLDRDELIDDVRNALRGSGLPAGALTLEVTESALMRDADAAAERLQALKALGVRIAIDDFGTGYSSLAYLRQFAVDQLKIDRSFIQGVTSSEQSATLVHTLVRLGKSLELETLAEGIEEEAQLAELRRQHCDSAQGYLFARPLAADAVVEYLRSDDVRNHPRALV